ncbi:monocarboxylate transporter 13-like [Glandiceps talaboti]
MSDHHHHHHHQQQQQQQPHQSSLQCGRGATTEDKPKDGGCLGWLVVLGAFVCAMFVFGVFQAIGPIFVVLQKHFNQTSAGVSWIMSLMVFLQFGLGPIAPIFVKKFGYRMTVMIGSIVSTLGFFLSAFTSNVEFLYFSIGILVGTGYSLVVPPTLGIPALFIRKRYTLANALVVTGGGIGTIIFPLVIQLMIDNYGWRGAFIMFSALNAHMCVSASLFRRQVYRQSSGDTANQSDGTSNGPQHELHDTKLDKEFSNGCTRIIDYAFFVRHPSFLVFMVASFFAIGIGTYGSPAHFVARAESKRLGSLQEIAFMTSLFGIGSTFGRLVPPPLMLHFKCKSVTSSMLLGITFVLAGITNILSALANTYVSYSVFAVFFGLFNGIYFTLYSQVLKDILSPEKLIAGVGLACGIGGVGGLIGPICAGKIYDVSGSYDISFHFYGVSLILGGLIMLMDKPCNRRQSSKDKADRSKLEDHCEMSQTFGVDNFSQTGI